MALKIYVLTFLALLLCSAAYATTVYKWNEDGKIIYSQTPPPPGVEFEVVIEKDFGKTTNVATAGSASSGSTFEERQEQRQQEKTQKQLIEESNRIKQENCAIAKQNMESLTSRGQVTLKDGDLYRKLTEEERQEKIKETQAQVDEFCQS